MPNDNNNPLIWKYFKKGDIIRNSDNNIWGSNLFEINFFHGNDYLPLVSVTFLRKRKNGNRCNLDIRKIKLISSSNRPLMKIKKDLLLKLVKNKNEEAKRELIMRINTKKI